MLGFARPRVVLSSCLEFEACRYNGERIPNRLVRALTPHVEFVRVCPEVEIGLGVPRPTINLQVRDGEVRLIQPKTEQDLTDTMRRFSEAYLDGLTAIDGFLLKSRSPSCGTRDVKIQNDGRPAVERRGLFADAVLTRFPHLAIEHEGRLNSGRLRDHFLTKLFTLARFRELSARDDLHIRDLTDFQATHKFLFLAYHQSAMREIGRALASHDKKDPDSLPRIVREVALQLNRLFARPPRRSAHINVMEHMLGFVSDELASGERQHFLGLLEAYRKEAKPLLAARSVVESWVARFGNEYLANQVYLRPYPAELEKIPLED